MFLAIDECKEGQKKVLGGVLIPREKLASFEAQFVDLRLQEKVWGELKWNRLGNYQEKYTKFTELFFNETAATYHSICFRDEAKQYNAAYSLIRTVTWKLQNAGFSGKLYVLFDENGSIGAQETKKIRDYAKVDGQFKLEMDFCSQGASHVMGLLQIADLITGTIHAEINSTILSEQKELFYKFVRAHNGQPLSLRGSGLPFLNEQKIHFFDPDDRITSSVQTVNGEKVITITRGTSKDKIRAVGMLLKSSPGTQQILINIPGSANTTTKVLELPYMVQWTDNLERKISTLLG